MLDRGSCLDYYSEGVADGVAGQKTQGCYSEAEADHFEETAFERQVASY